MEKHNESKRKFLKTVVYVAPVIASFSVTPAIAGIGSNKDDKPKGHHKKHGGHHKKHGGQHGSHHSEGEDKGYKFFAKKNRFFSRKSDRHED